MDQIMDRDMEQSLQDEGQETAAQETMKSMIEEPVDAVILTGGIAHDAGFVRLLLERVQWIAPCLVYPGEDELLALAQGALQDRKSTV